MGSFDGHVYLLLGAPSSSRSLILFDVLFLAVWVVVAVVIVAAVVFLMRRKRLKR